MNEVTMAPPLRSGLYVYPSPGKAFHVAATPEAQRTQCGMVLPIAPARIIEVSASTVPLDFVCRRCAGRHLEFALALGLVSE